MPSMLLHLATVEGEVGLVTPHAVGPTTLLVECCRERIHESVQVVRNIIGGSGNREQAPSVYPLLDGVGDA